MKEKIQVKISREGFITPQIETSINKINNEAALEIANNLQENAIKELIHSGMLKKNEVESNDSVEVYDLIY